MHKRILIVDDNEDSAESMAMFLRMSGHEVTTVPEGNAAIDSVQTLSPNLILLDIGLPGMNGYDVCRGLRKRGYRGQLVAITGYANDSDRERSTDAGFDQHLAKPVDLGALEQLLGL
jgi:two-component system, chemotaxis family, CheB/CheR fusion protein